MTFSSTSEGRWCFEADSGWGSSEAARKGVAGSSSKPRGWPLLRLQGARVALQLAFAEAQPSNELMFRDLGLCCPHACAF